MPGKECYHCHEVIPPNTPHDCWTTTAEKLTEELPEPMVDAWLRIRDTALDFGEQRTYASHKSIMFSRKACYFFVRPKKKVLEVVFFLGRTLKNPLIRKVHPSSKVKTAHLVHISHRDEVEAPFTDWLREAYEVSDSLRLAKPVKKAAGKASKKPAKKPARRSKKH